MINETNYSCPILPLRDIVVFPDVTVPLFVGRDKSIKSLEASMEKYKKIILVSQKIQTSTIHLSQIFILLEQRVKFFNY